MAIGVCARRTELLPPPMPHIMEYVNVGIPVMVLIEGKDCSIALTFCFYEHMLGYLACLGLACFHL
jgi:hypothetical protein